MGIITIRDVPDDLRESIKARAKRNHRSMEKEALAILAKASEDSDVEARKEDALVALKSWREAARWENSDSRAFDREDHYEADERERGLR